jgi:hypothetical protein
MNRRAPRRVGARESNYRLKMLLWIIGLTSLTISLIVFEQTAILYVLATLGVTALLVIVALADLSGAKGVSTSELGDDAAAIGSGITGATAATAPRQPLAARRAAAKRK